MSDIMIKTEGLGKKYIISHEAQEKYTALRDVIQQKAKGFLSHQGAFCFRDRSFPYRNFTS